MLYATVTCDVSSVSNWVEASIRSYHHQQTEYELSISKLSAPETRANPEGFCCSSQF